MITATRRENEIHTPTVGFPPPAFSLGLAARPSAVRCARMFIRYALTLWKLSHLVETVELIASELVTNAVKATGITTPQVSWGELEDLQLLRVRVHASKDSIVIQVWDADGEPLDLQTAGTDDESESGRGLFIVKSLARQMGRFYPRSGGKVVWAELPLDSPVPPLPRRAAKKAVTINLPEADPDVLRAVLAGLRGLCPCPTVTAVNNAAAVGTSGSRARYSL